MCHIWQVFILLLLLYPPDDRRRDWGAIFFFFFKFSHLAPGSSVLPNQARSAWIQQRTTACCATQGTCSLSTATLLYEYAWRWPYIPIFRGGVSCFRRRVHSRNTTETSRVNTIYEYKYHTGIIVSQHTADNTNNKQGSKHNNNNNKNKQIGDFFYSRHKKVAKQSLPPRSSRWWIRVALSTHHFAPKSKTLKRPCWRTG